ncbi:MAG: SDR family NAD(P)-dependent oxidoreductase [Candidatus Eisenbacteria bacterium]|uniref:SDR family NAD(P)-dependent oxidoreductase n=1 Tax=Eiseniibacteriota bacterium TaxID=2212470 RepID=A0A7Y2H0T5_UNCEI|nr:SDR family NAD(P)-dependent oxidoreductase [Candidatus Eisenbacteria bacterium]
MNLDGAKTLVTGGSLGIGKAIAAKLIQKGGSVAISSRSADNVNAAAKELGANGIVGDVSQEADAIRMVQESIETMGGLDILINNAGIGRGAPLVEMTREMMEEVFHTNVLGAMMVGREAARHFVAQESGNIMNISSTAGLKGFARGTAYCASKFALKGMTECWRDELRRHNVRVTLVNPSEVQTGWGGRKIEEINPKKLVAEDIADAVVGILEMEDRGFVPEFSVFATNPF